MSHHDPAGPGEPEAAEAAQAPAPVQIEPDRSHRIRRIGFILVAAVTAASLVLLIVAVALDSSSRGALGLLVGRFDSTALAAVAVIAVVSAGTIALFAVPADGWWLVLMIPARIIAALATLLTVLVAWLFCWDDSATALRVDGCETGYTVVEESFLFSVWGDVYQQDGVIVRRVERTSGDDAYRPFAHGAYVAKRVGDSIRVWYSFGSGTGVLSTDGEPAFTLPVREGHGC